MDLVVEEVLVVAREVAWALVSVGRPLPGLT